LPFELRLITTAMKIAHDLERVGDEATTISRRCLELSREAPLQHAAEIPRLASMSLQLLKEALDTFVSRDPGKARELIPRDTPIDALNRQLHADLAEHMARHPEAIRRCLNLMVIAKSLERIGDHATNVAEMVVFLYEGHDIRHTKKAAAGRQPVKP
jgi:phosphate transport system protein